MTLWRAGIWLRETQISLARVLAALHRVRLLLLLDNLLFAVPFCGKATAVARRIARRAPLTVFYGYEIHGVLAVRLLWGCVRGRSVVVSRLQGTKLYGHVRNA